jgi:signal transduction histidine kinase
VTTPATGVSGTALVLTDMARIALNFRLVAGLCTLLVLLPDSESEAQYAAVVLTMAVVLALLLAWQRVGQVLVHHPAALAVDVLLAHAALTVVGVDTPFFYVVAGSALLCGLCLGIRGALYFSVVFFCLWFLAVAVNPPSAANGSAVSVVLVNEVFVQGALFAGVTIRRLVLARADSQRRARHESLMSAAAEERARLARELHDSLAKSLHGMSLAAEGLQRWIDRDPARARADAHLVASSARQAVQESRRILRAMRADDLAEPLETALTRIVRDWEQRDGRTVALTGACAVELAPSTRYELLAIVGESLENVSRHAPDAAVTADLSWQDGWLEVVITDDGPGLAGYDLTALQRQGHYGVVGMHERAARLGGTLRIVAPPGGGTRVIVRVPAADGRGARVDTAFSGRRHRVVDTPMEGTT